MLVYSLAAPASTETEWLSQCDAQAKPEMRIRQALEMTALPQWSGVSTVAGIQFLPSNPSDLADTALVHLLVTTQSITTHTSSSVTD